MPLEPGQSLLHYRLIDKIGEGGMGVVWSAEDSVLKRTVAVKFLPQDVAESAERLARFQREAQLLASLNHPNIAAVYGLHEADKHRFIAMEMISGEDLAQRLARGPIPVDEALAMGQSIARALEAAHESGVIHRDLKPANIKLTDDGNIKVLDFGLAKALDNASDSGTASMSPTLTTPATLAGTILGTAAYMSPEQAKGKPADRRVDIWAFGCVLFEMLTGARPFKGDGISETLASVIMGAPAMEQLPERLPPGILRLVNRCLEKDPQRRLRDIGEARFLIEETLAGRAEGTAAEPEAGASSSLRGVPVILTAGIALAAAILAAGVIIFTGSWFAPTTRRPVRFHAEVPAGVTLRPIGAVAGPVSVSPNGRHVVFGGFTEDGSNPLFVRSLDNLEARPISGTNGGSRPFWSHDSRMVAFFANNKLRKVDLAGGPPLTLCDAPNGRGGTWNSEDIIVFAPESESGLHRVAAAGGESMPITVLDEALGEETHRYPHFLPDGRRFIYLARIPATGDEPARTTLYAGSLDNDQRQSILRAESQGYFDSGHLLFLRESTLMAQPFDPDRLKTTGDPFPIAENVQLDTRFSRGSFSAGSGVVAFHSGASREEAIFQWVNRDGQVEGTVGNDAAQSGPQIAPDGGRVAFNLIDPETGNWDVWVHEIDRNVQTRLTFGDKVDASPKWSPDGKMIVYASDASGDFDLYMKSASGTGKETLVLDTEDMAFASGWTPDGRQILFGHRGEQTNGWDVAMVDLETGEQRPLLSTTFDEGSPRLSPDGRWLAYVSDESGRDEIYVAPFPSLDGKWQISRDGGNEPVWPPSGDELYYLLNPGTIMAAEISVREESLAPGSARPLFDATFSRELGSSYTISPDGQRFLLNVIPDGDATSHVTVLLDWHTTS
jgi:Tol biopolymer transport system component/tRNA A-37 threonylcarbamoyl transferase component Bud32